MNGISLAMGVALGMVSCAAVLVGSTGLRAWREFPFEAGAYPFARVMTRLGLQPRPSAGTELDLAVLAGRCGGCDAKPICARWLDSPGTEGLEGFCANANALRAFPASRAAAVVPTESST